ncbi:hypothetical protein EB796_021777 [Bugula neritina]|uniref:Uncharacterized protein n=1 Tax=Bugula neritina TaxID=10212 RepID=A0A7J7J3A2_BUGNE|nr:hypothetical protein EB796_021777 [Bugula neritina]
MDNQKINSKARRRSLSTKQHVNTSSEPEYTGITTQQALIYFAIILACFVVVYPKMIHPMLKYALGFQEPPPTESKKSDLPPQLLNRGKPHLGLDLECVLSPMGE